LLGLEVVEEDGALLGLFTPVLDDDARAVDDLAGVALTVDLACEAIDTSAFHVPPQMNVSQNRETIDVHKPAHSPSCFPSGTLMSGILCSPHRATTSFL
jgi:hypothetical protein